MNLYEDSDGSPNGRIPSKAATTEVVESKPARAVWVGKFEFVLTLVGYAVGLGNVWRFPYLTYANGGGAFLIPYIVMLFLVGIPVFFMEVCFGQFSSLGPVAAWKMSPLFKGVGVAAVIVNAYWCCYYNVIVAWCLYYFFSSLGPEVPWKTCNNWWNTKYCVEGRFNASASNWTLEQIKTPSEEYFYRRVLEMSGGIEHPDGLVWQMCVLLFLGWLVIFMVLIKGINSMGKVMYFVSIFPYFLLTAMLIRGATLDGARDGIEFYIKPNFTRLGEIKVWGDAATQICYALGICCGNLIAMASYNNFRNNAKRDSILVPLVSCSTSLYAGFVIFSVLGYMSKLKGTTVDKVATSGPGLTFVVYPEGLSQMPISPLWSTLFFIMMSSLGFSSQFSAVESIACVIMDEFPAQLRSGVAPIMMRGMLCSVLFLLGLPMVTRGGYYMFQIVDEFSAGYSLLTVGIMETVAIMYSYGHKRFTEDIALMLGYKPGIFWQFTWRFLSPVLLILILTFKAVNHEMIKFGNYVFPYWASVIAWLIVAFPLVMALLIAFIQLMRFGGCETIKKAANPATDWGPSLKENREGTMYEIDDRVHTKTLHQRKLSKSSIFTMDSKL